MPLSAALIRRRRRLPTNLSGAASLLATWANSDGGLAFDFTDITASQPFGSGKIIDSSTPANNWETSASVDPFDKLTWTGASLRMSYGSDGVLRYAPHNLILQSQTFDNASWAKNNITITANAAVAPDGTTTADLLYPTTSGATRRLDQFTSLIVGQSYTFSLYIKAAGINFVRIAPVSANSSNDEVWFDLVNGTVGTTGPNVVSPTITSVGNGFYRITASQSHTGTAATLLTVCDADGSSNVTANGTDGIYIWGAQLQALPVHSTDYIATTSSAVYKPRIDFDPSTLDVRGLLVEEARTNLLLYSQDFSNAAWIKVGTATVTTDTDAAPDGTTTVDTINLPADTDWIYQAAGAAGTQYTLSAWLSGSGTIYMGAYDEVAGVQNTSLITLTSTPTRHTFTFTYGVGSTDRRCFVANRLNNGSTTTAVKVWGAQLEAGAFCSSLIPTTSASVTRAADEVSLAVSSFNYSTTSMTWFVEAYKDDVVARNVDLINTDANSQVPLILYSYGGGGTTPYALNGTLEANMSAHTTYDDRAVTKIAFAYTSPNDAAGVTNGGTPITDVSGSVGAAPTNLRIGWSGTVAYASCHIRKVMVLSAKRLTNADLQTLTT